jgi:hypothetical protein
VRIIKESAEYFHGTHKGADIEIVREMKSRGAGADSFIHRPGLKRYYIIVTTETGGRLYDGYAPETITNMAAAKREAIRGACL